MFKCFAELFNSLCNIQLIPWSFWCERPIRLELLTEKLDYCVSDE